MRVSDFTYDDVNYYYGIDNFKEINDYIAMNGLDVETACRELGMNTNQISIVMLIYAREFYSMGDFEKGDGFILRVEKSQNKTSKVIEIMNEIKRNKKFYQHRRPEQPKGIALSIKPYKQYKKN